MSTEQRRMETRQKIILGGLIIKAGLARADKGFILGALMEASKLNPQQDSYDRLRNIGQKALNEAKKKPENEMRGLHDPSKIL